MDMSNHIAFKDLWQRKSAEPPSLSEIYGLAAKSKRGLLKKTMLINFIYGITAVFIIGIWLYYQPQLLTTKIGISVTIIAISSFVMAQNRMLPLLKKEADNVTLNDYLEQLKQIRQKELFMQTTMMNVYFVLLSIGILLYMYEYVAKNFLSISVTYGISIAWIAFNWFYLRPKTIKKEQNKTNSLIAKFENLQKQLGE